VDEGEPRASIALFAGRTLELVPVEDGHVLRDGKTAVARIAGDRAETVDGRWTLANRRGASVDARRDGSEQVVATYRPGIAGGVLKVVGGSSYALRPPFLGEAMKLRRRASRRVVASVVRRGWYDVTLADGAATEPDLALVVVVMLQAVLVEALMPPSSGGGSGM
jgi:hypothetical protein